MFYIYFTKKLGEVLSTSKVESINELFIWSVSLIVLLVPLLPILKRFYIVSTMEEFEKVIIEKNQKVIINLYQSFIGPISMMAIYLTFAIIFSFLITQGEFRLTNFIVSTGLISILIFTVTILILLMYGVLRDIFGIDAKLIKFLNKELIKKISLINLTLYINSVSGLITYTIGIQYLIYSTEKKSIMESLILILIPVLLFILYRFVNNVNLIEKYKYTYKILAEQNAKDELFVFLYNLDATRTVLKRLDINDEDEYVRVIYNAENGTYTEYKRFKT